MTGTLSSTTSRGSVVLLVVLVVLVLEVLVLVVLGSTTAIFSSTSPPLHHQPLLLYLEPGSAGLSEMKVNMISMILSRRLTVTSPRAPEYFLPEPGFL